MLRKQWQQELEEKFYLPSVILDTKVHNRLVKDGSPHPFDQENRLVICSYHFASAKSEEISRIPWHIAVIDEAHRLRNVYRSRNRTDPSARKSMSQKITDALERVPKLLLTATPLQNSLMELYGLVSVIDEHVFGDSASFREQFVRISNNASRNEELKQRLDPICIRTLRKQVMEYVPFTRRVPITREFLPSDAEYELYEKVSSYLQRESLFALPASQRQLITLILRKLLASSTFAIARTLLRLVHRLENIQEQMDLLDDEDLEGIDELEDEWQEDGTDNLRALRGINPAMLKDELNELRRYANLADSIRNNAKGVALVPALQAAFEHAQELGAARKAVIFTESRQTQEYLFDLPWNPQRVEQRIGRCHRDDTIPGGAVAVAMYDDHLEITNPGPPQFGITPEKLAKPHQSKPCNPIIANVLYRSGIIERWGTGTLNIIDWCAENANPPPAWHGQAGSVYVTFLPAVLPFIPHVTGEGGTHASGGSGTKLALSRHQVLNPLLEAGLIEMTTPSKPRSKNQRYRLTEKGRAVVKDEGGRMNESTIEISHEKR